jgi:hypothetical protein
MNEQSTPDGAPGAGADGDADRDREAASRPKPGFRERRRLDEVFGEVLPTVTGDERDPEPADGAERERWYRENRPPHHG